MFLFLFLSYHCIAEGHEDLHLSFIVLTYLEIWSTFSYFLYMVWNSDMKVCLGVVKSKQYLIWAFEFISKKIPLKIWTAVGFCFVCFCFQFHIPVTFRDLIRQVPLSSMLLNPSITIFHLFQMKDSYYETISSEWESLPFNLVVDLNHIFN